MNLKTISVSEASMAVNLPRAAIYRLLESGAVAGNRNGKHWRVLEESLYDWATQRQTATVVEIPQPHDPENPFV